MPLSPHTLCGRWKRKGRKLEYNTKDDRESLIIVFEVFGANCSSGNYCTGVAVRVCKLTHYVAQTYAKHILKLKTSTYTLD